MRSHVIDNLRKPLILAQWPSAVEHFGRTYAGPRPAPFTAVDDLSFEVGGGRDRRADRPQRRRQDHHAAVARRHPEADLRARRASTATTSSPTPLEAKRRLAFMPDEPHLFEYLTVDEHLRLIARLYGVADFERRARGAARRARADGQGALAARRAVARHAAESGDCLRPGPRRDDAAVRRAADRPRSDRHPPDARDDRRARRAPAPRSCCRRTCCTWSRRSARASSSWTAAARSPTARSPSSRARADLAEAGSSLEQIFLRVTGHDIRSGQP